MCGVCACCFKFVCVVCCAFDAACDGVWFVFVGVECLCVVSVAYCLMWYGLLLCGLLCL